MNKTIAITILLILAGCGGAGCLLETSEATSNSPDLRCYNITHHLRSGDVKYKHFQGVMTNDTSLGLYKDTDPLKFRSRVDVIIRGDYTVIRHDHPDGDIND